MVPYMKLAAHSVLSFAELCFIFVDLPPPVPPPPVPRNRNIQKPTLPIRRLDTENMGKIGIHANFVC